MGTADVLVGVDDVHELRTRGVGLGRDRARAGGVDEAVDRTP